MADGEKIAVVPGEIELIQSILLPEGAEVLYYMEERFVGDVVRFQNTREAIDGINNCICVETDDSDGYYLDV